MKLSFKKLIFVSGKGGVGKTSLALLVSRHLARLGQKVLYVELMARSSARPLAAFDFEPEYKPQKTQYGFDACLLSGRDCLVDYVSSFVPLERIVQPFFQSSMIQGLINLAPGLKDLAILGKLTSAIRSHGPSFQYDHIVIDAHSTGHFLSFLQAPGLLGQSVKGGPLRTQSESIEKVLKDPQLTQFIFASLFEELPVDELVETIENFKDQYKGQSQIFMNKWIDLESCKIQDPSWQLFIKNRISGQSLLQKRLDQLSSPYFHIELILENFPTYLYNAQGDFLRTPSAH